MPQSKEERRSKQKVYEKTPKGEKVSKKSKWKYQGIIIKNFDEFYEKFLSIKNCQICKKKLTVDKKMTHSTRVVDHDHNITDKENVRNICCHACNSNDNSRNTSGEPNISYNKRDECWVFIKEIQGKKYSKAGFETKEEAIHYKYSFLHKLKQIEINKQITSEEESRKTKIHRGVFALPLGHEYSS